MAEYTNPTLISNYLQRALTDYELSSLATILPAIRMWIDNITNSTFGTSASSTRYYDGDGSETLDVEPLSSVTSITLVNSDGSDSYAYTADTEYFLEPQNTTLKNEIRRRYGCWPRGKGNIKVVAVFGEYSESTGVPYDIETIATFIAAEIINRGKQSSNSAPIQRERLDDHDVTYDTSSAVMDGMANDPAIKSLLEQRTDIFV